MCFSVVFGYTRKIIKLFSNYFLKLYLRIFNNSYYADIYLKYLKSIDLINLVPNIFLNLKLVLHCRKNRKSMNGILFVRPPVGQVKNGLMTKIFCNFEFEKGHILIFINKKRLMLFWIANVKEKGTKKGLSTVAPLFEKGPLANDTARGNFFTVVQSETIRHTLLIQTMLCYLGNTFLLTCVQL